MLTSHLLNKKTHKNNATVLTHNNYFIHFDNKTKSRADLAASRPSTQDCRQLDGWYEGKYRNRNDAQYL